MRNKLRELKKYLRDNPSIGTSWDLLGDVGKTNVGAKVCVCCKEDHNEATDNVGDFQVDPATGKTAYFCRECWNASLELKKKQSEFN